MARADSSGGIFGCTALRERPHSQRAAAPHNWLQLVLRTPPRRHAPAAPPRPSQAPCGPGDTPSLRVSPPPSTHGHTPRNPSCAQFLRLSQSKNSPLTSAPSSCTVFPLPRPRMPRTPALDISATIALPSWPHSDIVNANVRSSAFNCSAGILLAPRHALPTFATPIARVRCTYAPLTCSPRESLASPPIAASHRV
ncbi:hypothetical protein CERSUDRAFT_90194 [Gelatoporia subvermispora B]|uniref:Uncharacterized protein n=1 Tax=Ceriporiopsis subvermispora (strain B) TaxID=914234 RepID=M2RRU6_CERS8|nr:hypothetical protein CERSUDRAFT_90194 [Gelatoporia subvermispora B]